MPDSAPWWQTTTVYQVYLRSFADSGGDGIGDLPGLIDRLDYLHELGVETLWLSPFFHSPQEDFGYDISDYRAIAPEYGTLDDCRRLIDEVHRRGMKIVFDLVLNHTSRLHPWFLESKSSRTNPKRDWYLWRDGHGRSPPTNWRSFLGGTGWHLDESTGQWYWASFLPFQPDLNYRHPEVKQAMLEVVRHWLRQGVDGLRLDLFNALFKDAAWRDNPFSFRPIPDEENPDGFFQHHQHTINHPDTFAFARELRAVVDEFHSPPRFMVGEVFGATEVLKQYLGRQGDGLNLVFLFKAMRTRFTAPAFRALLEEFETDFAAPACPTWVFGNHDRPRVMEKLGNDPRKLKLLLTLQLTARGVPFLYYGDELGMRQADLPARQGKDPVAHRFAFVPHWLARRLRQHGIPLNRDECRTPMQWTAAPHAGFCPDQVQPWLPVHPCAAEVNVAAQSADPHSVLATTRRLLRLRRDHPALNAGLLELLPDAPAHVLAYRRTAGAEVATVFLNFSGQQTRLELQPGAGHSLHSNLHPQAREAVASYQLEAYEGLIVLSP